MGVSEAWERFRLANGVPDAHDFRSRIVEFASRRSSGFIDVANPVIGCILVDDCVFLAEDEMVEPTDIDLSFPNEIVKYKRFMELPDLADRLGHVSDRVDFDLVDPSETSWKERREKRRQSQGIFRDRVLRAYGKKCALSDESCTTVLEAAHIQPFYSMKSNHVQNGLSLRIDLHRLFDFGLISFTDQHEVMVSSSVSSEGVRAWSGKRLKVPNNPAWQPSPKALAFHRQHVFRT
jgi:putative restriction endonuclease